MNFPGLMAKVKALNSKILTKEQVQKLFSAPTLQDLFRQLQEDSKLDSSFSKKTSDFHRRDVEIMLRKKIMTDFYNIFFYLPADGKKFFKFMERRFEIENIKYVFRQLHSSKPESISEDKLFPLKHFQIDPKEFSRVKNIDDLLKLLKETPYYPSIQSVYNNYKKENCIKILLNALDLWYFMSMKSLLKGLPIYGSGLKKIFYVQIDLTNIEWIYRSRILFNLDSHETLNYIIPVEGKLTKDFISKLSSSKNLEEFLDNLKVSPYGEHFKKVDKDNFSYVLQRISYRILAEHAKMLLAKTDNGLDVLGGYIYIREYEYMDIVSIIESKRYSIPKEKARDFLVLWR